MVVSAHLCMCTFLRHVLLVNLGFDYFREEIRTWVGNMETAVINDL